MKSASTIEGEEPAKRCDSLAAIVLAAGKGTRMKSRLPKVLHPLGGMPMVEHVLRAIEPLDVDPLILTIGPATEQARELFQGRARIAWQAVADGTAGAAAAALEELSSQDGYVLVVNGDVPLVTAQTLADLTQRTREAGALAGIGTFQIPEPNRYGRVQRDPDGRVTGVIEAADDAERQTGQVTEANSGIYCFDVAWLRQTLPAVTTSASGERYLTDLIAIACSSADHEQPVITVSGDPDELVGVDDRVRLAEAERTLRERVLVELMRGGVTIVDPQTTYIDAQVQIEADVRIEPGCHLRGETIIRQGAVIGPDTMIDGSQIGEDVAVKSSWIEGSIIHNGVHIGPYAHLRPGTVVEAGAHIGNFVEMKNTRFGSDSHAGHFSYLGDAVVGRDSNIGAGTVTCNFDGQAKHQTEIGDRVFVGSDSMLIAPVELGDDAATGAGSVVTRSVPAGKRAVGVPARIIGDTRNANSETDPEKGT